MSSLRAHRARGMTIIEMMVVLAVIGLLVIVGYMGVRHVRKSDLREQTVQIASILRNAYNMATQTGKHHRVVFDLEEQTFKVEACKEDIKLRLTAREEIPEEDEPRATLEESARARGIDMEMLEASSPEEAHEMAGALMGKKSGRAECQVPRLPSGDADGRGNERKIRTDRGIEIRRIHAQHLEEPAVDGIATVNFFPLGRAEKAIVEIADDDGNQYSLLVHGLTGRVEFRQGELRDPNDHMKRDATGEEIEER